MRQPPRRAANPGFREPCLYLQAGLLLPGTSELRPELTSEIAAAMGRECLIRSIPLARLEALARELAAIDPAGGWPFQREQLAEVASRPLYQRQDLLAQLLAAGVSAIRQPADLVAFTRHVQRILTLATFSRVLGQASALESLAAQARLARQGAVRKFKE